MLPLVSAYFYGFAFWLVTGTKSGLQVRSTLHYVNRWPKKVSGLSWFLLFFRAAKTLLTCACFWFKPKMVNCKSLKIQYVVAQKINALNLRLNKRLNWNVNSCVHNYSDYGVQVTNAALLLDLNKKSMSKLCVSKNKTKLVKTSKLSAFCYEFFDQRFFFYFTKILCLPRRTSISKYRSGYLKFLKIC